MEIGCPVCNGFLTIGERCDNCKEILEDLGPKEDYYNPYSPYEEQDGILMLQEGEHNCIHRFFCCNCKSEKDISIPLELM